MQDRITLGRLRQAAEALDCTLAYVFIPNKPLEETIRGRAHRIADEQLARATHTMRLENQALASDALAAERERLVGELLRGNPRRLWDVP
jgi:predicted DNA-binding mobile mystery protein A